MKTILKRMPDTTLRHVLNTPSFFFLIWRWSTWLSALISILWPTPDYRPPVVYQICTALLFVTFIQTLIVTLYSPLSKIFIAQSGISLLLRRTRQRLRIRPPAVDAEADILAPLSHTRNRSWNIAIYSIDVIICGLIMYYSGPFWSNPGYGIGSPFYRYGMSTAFAAALAYGYRGGLIASIGYDIFVVLGALVPAPGAAHLPTMFIDVNSLIDTPLAALLSAYLISLIANYARSKKREQAEVRQQRALLGVSETIIRETSDRKRLLQKSAEQLRRGGHFQYVLIALAHTPADEEERQESDTAIDICVEASIQDADVPYDAEVSVKQVLHSGQILINFDETSRDGRYGTARLYIPVPKDGPVRMVLGAESRRQTPFDSKQEAFLTIAGAQLLVALDNMRLAEQTIELAATAERSRIAREIHDGIAQITYMLSLQAETCATQAHRIAEASEEDAELLTPLATRLDKLVSTSKQALWETRNYMFSLKPLMNGTTTLTQMLTSQIREFQTISDLAVQLFIEGEENHIEGDQRRVRRQAQVGAAVFRIVQEALTNAYKHAEASQITVRLQHLSQSIAVEISDDGQGFVQGNASSPDTGEQRIYSGHGLRGMCERVEELGGELEISHTHGVKIRVWIPI